MRLAQRLCLSVPVFMLLAIAGLGCGGDHENDHGHTASARVARQQRPVSSEIGSVRWDQDRAELRCDQTTFRTRFATTPPIDPDYLDSKTIVFRRYPVGVLYAKASYGTVGLQDLFEDLATLHRSTWGSEVVDASSAELTIKNGAFVLRYGNDRAQEEPYLFVVRVLHRGNHSCRVYALARREDAEEVQAVFAAQVSDQATAIRLGQPFTGGNRPPERTFHPLYELLLKLGGADD